MEYRRTNPQSSLPTSPSHTHTYTNAITLDSWSISNPTVHPVLSHAQSGIHPQSYWSPCPFTGMHLQSHCAPCALIYRDVPSHKSSIQMPPTTFLPHPGFYVFILYIWARSKRRGFSPAAAARQMRSPILI